MGGGDVVGVVVVRSINPRRVCGQCAALLVRAAVALPWVALQVSKQPEFFHTRQHF